MPAPRPELRIVPLKGSLEPDSAALVRGLIDQQDWAVRSFWLQYAPLVFGILDRALGSRPESEDLTQEVLLGLFSSIKRLRDPEALRSFVVATTVLRLRGHLRWKRVRRFLSLSETGTVPEPVATGTGIDVPARDLLRRVYAMLDTLSAEDRTAFVLRNVEGFTLVEIASVMRASLATVKRRIRRAADRVEEWARSDSDLVEYLKHRAGERGQP